MSTQQYDVFICHASEDKDDLVRPIVQELEKRGITCWYDENFIAWGDSITKLVNEGLRQSKYVLVVLSPAMMQKHWPQRELNAALNQEASSGEVRVLPLLVGSKEEQREMIDAYPLLNDKLFQVWTGDPLTVADALQAKLGKTQPPSIQIDSPKAASIESVPLPRKKASITQRDKDIYLRDALVRTQEYFEFALRELELSDSRYSTDFVKMPPAKFTATIYVDGEVGNRCKIWVGGLGSSDSICYSQGKIDPYQDNSINEFLMLSESEQGLCLHASMGGVFGRSGAMDNMDMDYAAKYLWERFIERIS